MDPEEARREALALGLAVSAKAILLHRGRVLLLRNCRDEWELPGGRPAAGERLVEAVVREVREETRFRAVAGAYVDFWDYDIAVEDSVVRVISFVASVADESVIPALSGEHTTFGWFSLDELAGLALPDGYKRSIRLAATPG